MTRRRARAGSIRAMLTLGLAAALAAMGCAESAPEPTYTFVLPIGLGLPVVPASNPLTDAKIELGRRLFYDVRLSANATQSCGSCHQQRFAFADDASTPTGSTGSVLVRASMSLANVVYATSFTWANPTFDSLETQALVPLFAEQPVELGATAHEAEIEARLANDASYPSLFASAFPSDPAPVRLPNVLRAIASFERTLVSFDSAYDRTVSGRDPSAMSDSAIRGMNLFFTERLECFHCHGGPTFGQPIHVDGLEARTAEFHNNGLYNVGNSGGYPQGSQGLYEMTGILSDRGRFKAPTLRNIELTAPYMHDGSIETLEAVLDHYGRGGSLVTTGPDAGDGATNPYKSLFVPGFVLSASEREDVLAFLRSLTDWSFVCDARFGDPFGRIAPHARCAPGSP